MIEKSFEFNNPITFKNWNEHLLALKKSSIFYSSLWAKVLQQSYGYTPMYVTNFRNGRFNTLLPLMIINSRLTGLRAVSLPFTDYCDPIFTDKNSFKNIFQSIIQVGQHSGWKSLEIRGGSEIFQDTKSSLQYYLHQLSLSDGSTAFSKFKSNTKRNIRKAEREGVQVKITNSSEAMENFYQLNCKTRKKHGLPPQPKRFFMNVHEFIIKNNHGIIVSAFKNQNLLAAAIFFHFNNTAFYKYGASETKFLNLRANNLIMWEAIKYYINHEYAIFDFGKTEISNEGLLRFKRGWEGEEKLISYFKYDFSCNSFITEKNKETGWYNFLFNKMPMPLLKATGALLYKHVG